MVVPVESVSDRHSGDLGGALTPFDPAAAVSVRLVVSPAAADEPGAQHAAWMAVNLLARAEGIVGRVLVDAPWGASVRANTVPFGHATALSERLAEAATAIGVVPVQAGTDRCDLVLVVGSGSENVPPDALRIAGSGWWGGVARGDWPDEWDEVDWSRAEPLGPYVAACLAVAEVFLTVRAPGLAVSRPRFWGWNGWSQASAGVPSDTGRALTGAVNLADVGLAGVGAVGAAWMHALWAFPGARGEAFIADADAEGVSISNLNRGLLFRRSDLGRPKAEAAAAAAVGPISWKPYKGRFEERGWRPAFLVSAVDSNVARDVIQGMYPAFILSGSTRDLRAEVMSVGSPGVGACLRCFNQPETTTSDRELRERADRDETGALEQVAVELGAEMGDLVERLRSGACDALSERMLERLRRRFGDTAPAQFAVGFGSAMAGTMLAAETIRFVTGLAGELEGPSRRATFQFQRPGSAVNGVRPYRRDESCPKCLPGSRATQIWAGRRDAIR